MASFNQELNIEVMDEDLFVFPKVQDIAVRNTKSFNHNHDTTADHFCFYAVQCLEEPN